MLACVLPSCPRGGKPCWQGSFPSQGVPGKPGDAEHPSASSTHNPRWEGVSSHGAGQRVASTSPCLPRREKLSSDRISAKHCSKSENEIRGDNGAEQPFLEGEHRLQFLLCPPQCCKPSPASPFHLPAANNCGVAYIQICVCTHTHTSAASIPHARNARRAGEPLRWTLAGPPQLTLQLRSTAWR